MPFEGISKELERFIRQHVRTAEQLEVLLLLRRAPEECWSPTLVAGELQIEIASAARRLQDLAARGLVASDRSPGRYVYALSAPELSRLVDELAQLYTERRDALISAAFTELEDCNDGLRRA